MSNNKCDQAGKCVWDSRCPNNPYCNMLENDRKLEEERKRREKE